MAALQVQAFLFESGSIWLYVLATDPNGNKVALTADNLTVTAVPLGSSLEVSRQGATDSYYLVQGSTIPLKAATVRVQVGGDIGWALAAYLGP